MKLFRKALLAAILTWSPLGWAHVSMGGPAVTYGQNLEENGHLGVGGWGLFLGSHLRFGLAAYYQLNSFDPDGGSGNDFRMFYGGALALYAVNASLTAPIELNFGSLFGATRVSYLSANESKTVFVAEPTILALLRVYEWLAIGLDFRYRYVPDLKVGGITLPQLSGFLGGVALVFGSGDGR